METKPEFNLIAGPLSKTGRIYRYICPVCNLEVTSASFEIHFETEHKTTFLDYCYSNFDLSCKVCGVENRQYRKKLSKGFSPTCSSPKCWTEYRSNIIKKNWENPEYRKIYTNSTVTRNLTQKLDPNWRKSISLYNFKNCEEIYLYIVKLDSNLYKYGLSSEVDVRLSTISNFYNGCELIKLISGPKEILIDLESNLISYHTQVESNLNPHFGSTEVFNSSDSCKIFKLISETPNVNFIVDSLKELK